MNYYSICASFVPNAARIFLSVTVFAASFANLYAGGWPQPKNGLFAKLNYFSSSAASYYEPDGKEIIEFKEYDSVNLRDRRYAMDFSSTGIGLYAEYGLWDRLTLTLDFPFSSFGLQETYSIDANHFNYETRRKFSRTQYNWIAFGTRWQIVKTGHFTASLVGNIRIPPGFSSADTGHADYPFLSDGSFQAMGGTETGFSFTDGWIEAEARYNKRGDDFKNEILLHIEGGFSNIPKTYLKIFADAVISTNNFNYVRPFNPVQSQLQETAYNFGGSFMAYISDGWFFEASYSIRVHGFNTWNSKMLSIGGGIKIPALYGNEGDEKTR